MTPEPGLRMTDTLELVRELAKGGMGSIWVAEDLALRRFVAVKLISEDLACLERGLARFELEAQTNARIRSVHVPEIFSYGKTSDGTPFIVMELFEGVDLEERIRRDGPLSIRETLRIVDEIGGALAEAHALGIIHRDVKAENVFLANDGDSFSSKLLDFGIAKEKCGQASPHLTCSGGTLGTPGYISPEQQMSPSDADERSDVWSFGVVVYLCLTGSLPFSGASFGAVVLAVDKGRFVRASEANPGLSPAIDAWFEKALSHCPEDRFANVREMITAFRRATRRPSAWELATGRPAYTRLVDDRLEPSRKRATWAVAASLAAAVLGLMSFEPAWAAPLVVQAKTWEAKALATFSRAIPAEVQDSDVVVPASPPSESAQRD